MFEYGLGTIGWRDTYLVYGLFGIAAMTPLALLLRRPPPPPGPTGAAAADRAAPVSRIRPGTLMALLCAAIFGCCVAMSLPLAHLKSHVTDIGIAPMHAAVALSVLLAGSFVARAIASGLTIEWIGGLRTLFLFSSLQAATLGLLPVVEDFGTILVLAAVFGFGYGGIAPAYPVIVREFLPERWAGRCLGVVILFGTFGMAAGGWIGGVGFDATGGYLRPFLVGVAFNVVNLAIVAFLIGATRGSAPVLAAAR